MTQPSKETMELQIDKEMQTENDTLIAHNDQQLAQKYNEFQLYLERFCQEAIVEMEPFEMPFQSNSVDIRRLEECGIFC
jgi:hypothetical protein